jgi:hypothetical protein
VRNPQSVNAGKRRSGMQQARNGYEQTGVVESGKESSGGGGGPIMSEPVSGAEPENNREFQD